MDEAKTVGNRSEDGTDLVLEDQMKALLAACRLLVAISARSIAAVEHVVNPGQFRILVVVAGRGSLSLGQLAEAAGLSLSTASRSCDRMVGQGLLNRTEDPANRRQLVLTLTDEGRNVVSRVMRRRRDALRQVLRKVPGAHRGQLVASLQEFAAAGGEPAAADLWSLGWTD